MSIRIQILGVPSCTVAGAEQTELPAQKARFGLLVYLATERNVSRDDVAAVFWPESDDERARHALSQSIYELKRLLGEEWIHSQGGRLVISEDVIVDVHEFTRLCNEQSYERALELYRGPFLSGFFLGSSKAFETWVDRQRSVLERTHQRARRECVAQLAATSRLSEAIEVARRWVELDPFEDEANHKLIELLAQSGKRTEALKEYSSYERRLREELDIEPLERTKELIEAIRGNGRGADLSQARHLILPGEGPAAAPTVAHEHDAASNLVRELSRRRVFRMAAWYGGVAIAVTQTAQVMQDAFYLPPWFLTATAVLSIAGFPLAVVLSWQFDVTADGLVRADRSTSASLRSHWRVLAVALLLITIVTLTGMTVARSLLARGTDPVVCSDGTRAPCRSSIAIDPDLIAVLPLQHQPGTHPGPLAGATFADLMAEALRQWDSVAVADQAQTNDMVQRFEDSGRTMPVDTGLLIARGLGAGKLIMGTLRQDGDSVVVNASLYDAVSGESLRQAVGRYRIDSPLVREVLHRLAATLMLRQARLQVSDLVAGTSTSWDAIVAFDTAERALIRWDLEKAKTYYRAAIEHDTAFAYAHFKLASLMLWQNDTSAEWRSYAARARRSAGRLQGIDRVLAEGISALSEARFTQACELYRQALAQDSLNFNAWYGLSECLARDPTVIRDERSPSGWSFESSYEEALRAQLRALSLVPSFNESFRNLASSRLAALLLTNSNAYRRGVAGNGDTLRFAAFPALQGDTTSFVPYPMAEWARQPVPANHALALDRHRSLLKDAALTWVRAFPKNPRALEGLAFALESMGAVAPNDSIGRSSLAAVRSALEHEPNSANKLRLETAEVRMLVKAGRFREARRRAQAVLRKYKNPEPAQARRLAGMAGLIGDAHRMAALLTIAAPAFDIDLPASGVAVQPPQALARAASPLLAYAYVGVPVDSLYGMSRRAHQVLQTYVPAEQRDVVHAEVLDRVERMAFEVLGAQDVHTTPRPVNERIEIQSAVSRHETAEARRLLARLDSLQFGIALSDVAADGVLNQAQLLISLGDSSAAKERLDDYLNSLSRVPASQFNQPYQPVSIVRMMVLRAELAARTNERAAARKWARAVVDLWQDGSKELQPTLKRMRTLARL